MCPPVLAAIGSAVLPATASTATAIATGTSIVMGAASAGLQIRGQQIQAKTQAKLQENASKVERTRYLNEVSSLRTQQAQEADAVAQKKQANQRNAMIAQSTARVAALEAGVSGISVDALKQDLSRKEAMYNQSLDTQSKMFDVRREIALRDAGIGFTNNMLRINKPIEEVDYAGAIVGGATTGLSTYGTLKA